MKNVNKTKTKHIFLEDIALDVVPNAFRLLTKMLHQQKQAAHSQ
jgi:uncharacterized membrane protein